MIARIIIVVIADGIMDIRLHLMTPKSAMAAALPKVVGGLMLFWPNAPALEPTVKTEAQKVAEGLAGIGPGRIIGPEPENEADHFIVCVACGQAIDCRDLGEVFRHEEPNHEARITS